MFRCSLETQQQRQQNEEIRLACKTRQYAVFSTVTYLNERWMIMLLLLPLPLPLLMLLFSDFCCYQQHTLNVLFSPHLTFQSDWDVLVVVVADADAAAGVAVVLAPFFVSFFVCQLLLHQQLRKGRRSCLLKCFLKLLLLLLFT